MITIAFDRQADIVLISVVWPPAKNFDIEREGRVAWEIIKYPIINSKIILAYHQLRSLPSKGILDLESLSVALDSLLLVFNPVFDTPLFAELLLVVIT